MMKPMAQPPQRPKATQKKALRGDAQTPPMTKPPTKVATAEVEQPAAGSGKQAKQRTVEDGQHVMSSAETSSCTLSTFSMSSSFAREDVGREEEVTRQTRMPAPEMVSGNMSAPQPAATIAGDEAPTTSAAHVASPKEPKRSEPMPATSPTLSPTLSAMVPGLCGSSSGLRSSTTLPARSAPTSAALV